MTINQSTTPKIRWGILGSGDIAYKFAKGVSYCQANEVVAVASRNKQNAYQFAASFTRPPEVAEDYVDLTKKPLDVVYIATPHVCHREHIELCIKSGKHVLCEKPLTVNAKEAAHVIGLAKSSNLFLMEAMWMLFTPALIRLEQLIKSGLIGKIRVLKADFSFRTRHNKEGRLFDLSKGGGALLDVGIYPIALATRLLGPANEINGTAEIGPTGVDEQCAITTRHSGGRLAILTAATRTALPLEARVYGTSGMIKIHAPFFFSPKLTVTFHQDPDQSDVPPIPRSLMMRIRGRIRHPRGVLAPRKKNINNVGNGYNYEAQAVAKCIRDNLIECPRHSHQATLHVMELMDSLRHQWGICYPNDSSLEFS